MGFINIGYGNMINSEKIISMITYDSAPAKRMVQMAKESGNLIDATQGRKTRGVIACENGSIVLSALLPETIAQRDTESKKEEEA